MVHQRYCLTRCPIVWDWSLPVVPEELKKYVEDAVHFAHPGSIKMFAESFSSDPDYRLQSGQMQFLQNFHELQKEIIKSITINRKKGTSQY